MKYTNKWIVVPYSSINQKFRKKGNIADQILQNKSLSKEEKLAAYNNYIIRKLKNSKKQEEEDSDIKNDSFNTNYNKETDDEEEFDENYSDYDNDDLNKAISDPKTPKKEKSFMITPESPMDIHNETMENIQNLSMYNLPASKNTRSMRKISDKTFMRITENKKVQRKRKMKPKTAPSKQLKTEFGIIKKWTSLSKKKNKVL